MSLSLLRIFSSPHLSTSLFFPTPTLSSLCPSFLPKLPNAPSPLIVLCHRDASASKQGHLGAHEGAERDSGSEEDDDDVEQPMRASYDDDEDEEEGALSSLVFPERWDVLGLGQAMVIHSLFLSQYFFYVSNCYA